jgi:SAM-dependent methyltransferase
MSISELERNDQDAVAEPALIRRPAPPTELYTAGQRAIDEMLRFVGGLGAGFERRRALDFGSGIGHSSQALARHFQLVDGVDNAASMVELARSYNQVGDRCRYHLNRLEHLRMFGDGEFDFVFTDAVLRQHRPDNQLRFISEFHRVLRPGGLAVFDVAPRYAGSVRRFVTRVSPGTKSPRRRQGEGGPEVYCLRSAEVRLQVELLGARVVTDRPLDAGPESPVERCQFVIQRAR